MSYLRYSEKETLKKHKSRADFSTTQRPQQAQGTPIPPLLWESRHLQRWPFTSTPGPIYPALAEFSICPIQLYLKMVTNKPKAPSKMTSTLGESMDKKASWFGNLFQP